MPTISSITDTNSKVMNMAQTITVNNRTIDISSSDKLLFPNITKEKFVAYYANVADMMIPYIHNRPITMHRFPHGINEDGFYQKNAPDYFPDWIQRKTVEKKSDGTTNYVICNDAATLVYLANHDCITPHVWLSRIDHLERPDRLIFDLDPSQEDISALKETAWEIKAVVEECELTPFIMTTGSRGFHVTVPIKPEEDFDTARSFAESIADLLAQRYPDTVTTAFRKAKRKERIFIDTNRIAYAQTGVAPYAVRAQPGAPIATPIRWDELDNENLQPQTYTIKNIFRRLGQTKDPWKGIDRHKASLSKAKQLFKKRYGE